MPDTKSAAAYPEYIAFRTTGDGGLLLTVIAKLQPEDGARFPWGMWYHEQAPDGNFNKVPCSYMQLRIEKGVAEMMIDLIKLGRFPPPEFVAHLPLIE